MMMAIFMPTQTPETDLLSDPELSVLAALDFACWEDEEAGGDGWARPGSVAKLDGRSQIGAYKLLRSLEPKGQVERRNVSADPGMPYFVYAPTELGAELLLSLDA